VWTNTFSPGPEPESAVFRITAELVNTATAEDSPAAGCLKISIEFLSCKDCFGDVLTKKPVVLYANQNVECGASLNNYSLNYDDSLACGCNHGWQDRLIQGSYSGPWMQSYNPEQLLGYQGYCWTHPEAEDEGGYLVIESPQLWDGVAAHPDPDSQISGLATLEAIVRFDKKASYNNQCSWETDELFIGSSLNAVYGSSLNACSYTTTLHEPYTLLTGLSLANAKDLVPYGGDIVLTVNCDDEEDNWTVVGEIEDENSDTFYIRVRPRWIPDSPATCDVTLNISTESLNCTPHPDEYYNCPCDPSACVAGLRPIPIREPNVGYVYKIGFPTPHTSGWVTAASIADMPGSNTLGDPADTNECPFQAVGSLNNDLGEAVEGDGKDCNCPNFDVCACVGYEANPPDEMTANDFAPFGARYEVLYIVRNPDGATFTYSLVYTKHPAQNPISQPRGIWKADWNLPMPFRRLFHTCDCVDSCDAIFLRAKNMFSVNVNGRVPPRSLSVGGVSVMPSDQRARDVSLEVSLHGYHRLQQSHDPCCTACSGYVSYNCDNWYCNDCTCNEGECNDDLVAIKSAYCCPCSAIEHVTLEAAGTFGCSDGVSGTICEGDGDCTTGTPCWYDVSADCDPDNIPITPGSGPGYSNSTFTCNATSPGRTLVCNVYETWDDRPGCGSVFVPGVWCNAFFSCFERRWLGALKNTIDEYLVDVGGGVLLCNGYDETVEHHTTCTGDIVSTTTRTCGDCNSAVTTLTQTLSHVPNCDPGSGIGSTYLSVATDECSPARTYNCQDLNISGTVLFRMGPVTSSEADAFLADPSTLKVEIWLFPGNGDAECLSSVGTRFTAQADPWDGTMYWLYTTFSFTFNYRACMEAINPVIAFGDFCPTRPGALVSIDFFPSIVRKGVDPDCDDLLCLMGLKV